MIRTDGTHGNRRVVGADEATRDSGCPLRGQGVCSLTLLMEERGLDRLPEALTPEEMETCALCLLGRLAG